MLHLSTCLKQKELRILSVESRDSTALTNHVNSLLNDGKPQSLLLNYPRRMRHNLIGG